MTFRDDRDAQLARAEALERELAAARRERDELAEKHEDTAERAGELEKKLAALSKERDRLLAERKKQAPSAVQARNKRRAIFAVATSIIVFGVGYAIHRMATVDDPKAKTKAAEPREKPPEPAPKPYVPDYSQVPVAEPPPAPPPQPRQVTWGAKVTSATGVALEPGAECRMVIDDKWQMTIASASNDLLRVECGDQVLYDWKGAVDGLSVRDCLFFEAPFEGARDQWVYGLRCHDKGTRKGGRPQLTADSTAGKAVIWSDAEPKMRVELALDELSAPNAKAAFQDKLRPGLPLKAAVKTKATISKVEGEPPGKLAVGASCAVTVEPVKLDHLYASNCEVTVACGKKALGAEYARCVVARGEVVSATAEGKTAFMIDFRARTLFAGTSDWSMEMTLE